MFFQTSIDFIGLGTHFLHNHCFVFDEHSLLIVDTFSLRKRWCKWLVQWHKVKKIKATNFVFLFFFLLKERIHNAAAATCIMVASICLLITINGDKEEVLNRKFGEQSFVENTVQGFGKFFNTLVGSSVMDKFTNKYKRAGVYDEYTLAGVRIFVIFQVNILNCMIYCNSSSWFFFSSHFSSLVYWMDYFIRLHVLRSQNQSTIFPLRMNIHKIRLLFNQCFSTKYWFESDHILTK